MIADFLLIFLCSFAAMIVFAWIVLKARGARRGGSDGGHGEQESCQKEQGMSCSVCTCQDIQPKKN